MSQNVKTVIINKNCKLTLDTERNIIMIIRTKEECVVQELFDRYDKILSGELKKIEIPGNREFKTYSVTNFRGGIGKTTLSFNLAYAMCQKYMTLFLDMCPQQNFTSLLLNSTKPYEGNTIYDALMEKMMGSAWQTDSS